MQRRTILALGVVLGLTATNFAFAADVRPPGRVAHLGILTAASPDLLAKFGILDPFLQRLRELGYVEGQNLVIDYRLAEGRQERLPGLAGELVRLNVDVILATGPAAAHAAKNATTQIPVVFTLVGDAVAEGLVTNLARPDGNLTGVSVSGGLEIVAKRIQLLKEVVPSMTRMGLLWNPGNPSHAALLGNLPRVAKSAGVELQLFEARRVEDFEALFASAARDRLDGMQVLEDVIFGIGATKLAELTAQNHLPTIYGASQFVDVGGLMSYQANFATVNREAAVYVAKILRGAKPGSLPVEEPTEFDLVINLKAAKTLELKIPELLLLRANRVIQ